jgi:hypothetical protein
MAIDAITIHLPDDLYRRLKRLASLTHQPLEGLIVKTLSSSLPPPPDDLAPVTRDALIALESLNDDELRHIADETMADMEYQRLDALRQERRERQLTPLEHAELDRLMQAADTLVLRKAYAAVLLKWRGQALPSPTSDPGHSDTAP